MSDNSTSESELQEAWAVLRGETPAEPTTQTTTPADAGADTTTPSEPPAEQEQEEQQPTQEQSKPDEKPKNWNPEGPGKPSVALRQARAELAEVKRQAEETARKAAEYEAQLAAERQQREVIAAQARYNELLMNEGEEAAEAFAQQFNSRQQQQAQVSQQVERVAERAKLSEAYARKAFGDEEYDRRVQKFVSLFGQAGLAEAAQQDDPAGWICEKAASVFTQDDVQSLVAKQVAEAVQAELAKLQPQQPVKPAPTPRLATIPAAAPAGGQPASRLADIPQDVVNKQSPEDVREWFKAVIRQETGL